ncbi:MAG: hypothetical protein AAF533_11135 [Acidobacteriota bacterium]
MGRVASAWRLAWHQREEPLEVQAVVGLDDVAVQLAHRLLRQPDVLPRLRGLQSTRVLVVLGALDDLPWVDGLVHLGRLAGDLHLPTALAADLPDALLSDVFAQRFPGLTAPLAVLPDHGHVLSLHGAVRLDETGLHRWLKTSSTGGDD